MENMNYCQSCAMPMGGEKDLLGTNADGSNNEEYCKYCFKDGVSRNIRSFAINFICKALNILFLLLRTC